MITTEKLIDTCNFIEEVRSRALEVIIWKHENLKISSWIPKKETYSIKDIYFNSDGSIDFSVKEPWAYGGLSVHNYNCTAEELADDSWHEAALIKYQNDVKKEEEEKHRRKTEKQKKRVEDEKRLLRQLKEKYEKEDNCSVS